MEMGRLRPCHQVWEQGTNDGDDDDDDSDHVVKKYRDASCPKTSTYSKSGIYDAYVYAECVLRNGKEGLLMLQAIFGFFQVGERADVPYFRDGVRNIRRHENNQRFQRGPLRKCEKSILQRGVMAYVRGEPWLAGLFSSDFRKFGQFPN